MEINKFSDIFATAPLDRTFLFGFQPYPVALDRDFKRYFSLKDTATNRQSLSSASVSGRSLHFLLPADLILILNSQSPFWKLISRNLRQISRVFPQGSKKWSLENQCGTYCRAEGVTVIKIKWPRTPDPETSHLSGWASCSFPTLVNVQPLTLDCSGFLGKSLRVGLGVLYFLWQKPIEHDVKTIREWGNLFDHRSENRKGIDSRVSNFPETIQNKAM